MTLYNCQCIQDLEHIFRKCPPIQSLGAYYHTGLRLLAVTIPGTCNGDPDAPQFDISLQIQASGYEVQEAKSAILQAF
jgi:hypothetical protein